MDMSIMSQKLQGRANSSRKTKPFQLSNWFLVFVIAQALLPQGDMDDPGSWKDKKRSKIMAHSCTRRTLTIVSSILRVCPSLN